jgi:hypothetical protein
MQVQRYAAAVILCAATAACSPDVRLKYAFKIVDSKTHLPVQGVQVSVNGYGHYHNNRLFPGTEGGSGLPTDPNGVTSIGGLIADNWTYYIHFSKAGYQPVEMLALPSRQPKEWSLFYRESKADTSFTKRGGELTISVDKLNTLLLQPSSE